MSNLVINEYKDMTGYEKINLLKVMYNCIFNHQFKVRVLIQKMQKTRFRLEKLRIRRKLIRKYRIVVGMDTKIGRNFSPQHVEIGGMILRGTIGDNCTIYHQVTLGQRKIFEGGAPHIGDHVIIYTGARVVGNINVGDYAVIGANAVVTQDIEKKGIVVAESRNKYEEHESS